MEIWKKVFRVAAAHFSDEALAAVKLACQNDDKRLVQGCTTVPPPVMAVHDWDCEGACLFGYAAWQGDGLQTVGEISEYFGRLCYQVDFDMGEPAVVRWLLNWFDETPRPLMLKGLLEEVGAEIARRAAL